MDNQRGAVIQPFNVFEPVLWLAHQVPNSKPTGKSGQSGNPTAGVNGAAMQDSTSSASISPRWLSFLNEPPCMKIYELCLGVSAVAFGVLLYVAADFSRWKHYALLRLTAQRWRDVLLTRMEPIHLGGDELIERWEAPTCNELVWRAGRMLPDAVGLIQIPRDAIGFLSEVDIQTKSRLLRKTGFVRVSGLRPLVLSLLSKSKRFEICLDKAADGGGICTKADTSQGHVSVALEARIAVHFDLRIDSVGPDDTVLETLFCREVTLLYKLRSRLRDCLTQWAGQHVYAQAVRPFDLVDELNKSWTSTFKEGFPELIGWVSLTVSWVVLNPPETAEHARVKQIGERLVDLDLIEARLRQEQELPAQTALISG